MILYVNGDSNSLGTDLTDSADSWAAVLAQRLKLPLINQAKAGASNARILRTTQEYLATTDQALVIIGWTSWEREEWSYLGQYYDVNAGGSDRLPAELRERYKIWITDSDAISQQRKSKIMHDHIFDLHQDLVMKKIKHIFFNAIMPFQHDHHGEIKNWNHCFIGPYDNHSTYFWFLKSAGFEPNEKFHHTQAAQQCWASFLGDYIKQQNIL